jgi:prepilin-type N-terminal cleavage/methylation domain-containing protein
VSAPSNSSAPTDGPRAFRRWPRFAQTNRRHTSRGFTLIELIVVVVIISVLAVLAIPAITQRMRDRRTQQAAQQVAILYRNARMRAMGDGRAVLVRYANAALAIQEANAAIAGAGNNCSAQPAQSCGLNSWNPALPDNRVVEQFDPAQRGEFAGVQIVIDATPLGNANPAQMDVCFTPLGRSLIRFAQAGAFVPMRGVATALISRSSGGSTVGLVRNALLLPNGTARLAL